MCQLVYAGRECYFESASLQPEVSMSPERAYSEAVSAIQNAVRLGVLDGVYINCPDSAAHVRTELESRGVCVLQVSATELKVTNYAHATQLTHTNYM